MIERLVIDRPVVVEGKYDKIRLLSVIEADILVTDGFGIFREKEKAALLRRIAEKNGLIVLTDSDGGGLVIRNYLKSILPKDKLVHLYVPAVKGRERRKTADSKEGLLGVEGFDEETLRTLFAPYSRGADAPPSRVVLTKAQLYADGLSGGTGSAARRKILCQKAGLPLNISADAMLEALNLLFTYEEYRRFLHEIAAENEE